MENEQAQMTCALCGQALRIPEESLELSWQIVDDSNALVHNDCIERYKEKFL